MSVEFFPSMLSIKYWYKSELCRSWSNLEQPDLDLKYLHKHTERVNHLGSALLDIQQQYLDHSSRQGLSSFFLFLYENSVVGTS